jgi:uncharacterized protein (DUF4415 family)
VIYTIRRRDHEKKSSVLSASGKRTAKNVRHMPDSQIGFSNIPELSDGQLKRMRRVGRPATGMAKQLIAIRLSPSLLSTLHRMAAK